MSVATEVTYGLVVGGYRVKFTNWNGEEFFATKEDAQDFADKYSAYGYKCVVETIHFKVASN
jgi:hypothetical protein